MKVVRGCGLIIPSTLYTFFWDMVPESEIIVKMNSQINHGFYFLKRELGIE